MATPPIGVAMRAGTICFACYLRRSEVLALEGEKMDWENRTRLSYVCSSLFRAWGDAA